MARDLEHELESGARMLLDAYQCNMYALYIRNIFTISKIRYCNIAFLSNIYFLGYRYFHIQYR